MDPSPNIDHNELALSNGAVAIGQPAVRSPLGRLLFDHTIDEYPQGARRAGILALAIAATVVLYYAYFAQFGVTPNILSSFHMSFDFFIAIVVASNLLGAFASLLASTTDRLGRTNVVIYGLLVIGLLTAIGIPLTDGKWSYLVVTCLVGIVEGAILVATPALVRDFSPQLGRASAMGFWTIGPVAGALITSLVAEHTLNHFGQTHWKSQFVIAGCAALVVFVLSLFALKDLSPKLRDQLMVSVRDQTLVEARARGLTGRDLQEASEHPWRQILRWDLVGSSFGIALFLLLYYAAASLFTVYYPIIFKNPNGTNFTVTQANGLNTWFWTTDIVALIIIGLVSDALKVRKPFMVVGAIFTGVILIIFLGDATHPHTGYYTLATEGSLLGIGIALAFAPWIASFTESVEKKNPALVGTGLALWGWVLRVTIGVAFIVLTVVITSVNPIVGNLPVANAIIHGQSVSDFVAEHPKTIAFAQSHGPLLALLAKNPAAAAAVGAEQGFIAAHPDTIAFAESHAALLALLAKDPAAAIAVGTDPSPANIAAAEQAFGAAGLLELSQYKTQIATLVLPYTTQLNTLATAQKAFGAAGLLELAEYKTQLATLVEPYAAQLAFINAHQAALAQLEKGSAQAPHQWQHWFYVDLAGIVLFIPSIWLAKGRWKPSSAARDAAEHEAAVAAELARLIDEQAVSL